MSNDFTLRIEVLGHLLASPDAMRLGHALIPTRGGDAWSDTARKANEKYFGKVREAFGDRVEELPRPMGVDETIDHYLRPAESIFVASGHGAAAGCFDLRRLPQALSQHAITHWFHLAHELYDIDSAGYLRFKRSADEYRRVARRFPTTILKAARAVVGDHPEALFPPVELPRQHGGHFLRLLHGGIADCHVHLTQALLFEDLLFQAVANYRVPGHGGAFRSSVLERQARKSLSGAYRELHSLLLVLHSAWTWMMNRPFPGWEEPPGFRHVWEIWWRLTESHGDEYRKTRGRLWDAVAPLLSNPYSHWTFPASAAREEDFGHIYMRGFRYALARPLDREFLYHFIQALRLTCFLHQWYDHREWFHEFQSTLGMTWLLREYADIGGGTLAGYALRRHGKPDHPRQMQLRFSLQSDSARERRRAEPHKSFRRAERRRTAPSPETIRRQCDPLLKAYKRHVADCRLRHVVPMKVVFPISLIRLPERPAPGDARNLNWRWPFGRQWRNAMALADFYNLYPAYRCFFGYVDVAGSEDRMPNWPFALMLGELGRRVKPWSKAVRECRRRPGRLLPPCGIHYACHQGEHFHTPLHGLRKIGEALDWIPAPGAIGHALALTADSWSGESMPLDELLDDVAWSYHELSCHAGHGGLMAELEAAFRELAKCHGLYGRLSPDGIGRMLENRLSIGIWHDAYRDRTCPESLSRVGLLSRHHENGIPRYQYRGDTTHLRQTFQKAWRGRHIRTLLLAAYLGSGDLGQLVYFRQTPEGQDPRKAESLAALLKQCHQILCPLMRRKIGQRGLILEQCPESNTRIGNLALLERHPVFDLEQPGNPMNCVVLASDDPAVFQTTVEMEMRNIWDASLRRWPDMSLAERLSWMDGLRRRSQETCCPTLRTIAVCDPEATGNGLDVETLLGEMLDQ